MCVRTAWRAATLTLCLAAAAADGQDKPFPLPPREWPSPVMDQSVLAFLLVDRLEYRRRQGGEDVRNWDAQGWIGGDDDKLWIKSEGSEARGRLEDADIQLLYARRIAPYWHVQAGARAVNGPSPARESAVLGLQGLAPYWFDIEAMAFVDTKGKVSGRFEAENDLLVTQRLILQPHFETNFSVAEDEARRIGRGVNDVTLGVRLRYEIQREIAPYIGVNWTRKVADTADLARRAGESVGGFSVVAGVRIWY